MKRTRRTAPVEPLNLNRFLFLIWLLTLVFGSSRAPAQGLNRADEPLAKAYSYDRGVKFLEEAATSWSEKRKCVTCHTNGLALAVNSLNSDTVAQGRAFAGDYLLKYVKEGKQSKGQFGGLEGVVATTALLALSDARTGTGMQQATRLGLDYSWNKLDESGRWEDWLACNWPPFESDDVFGPALMLIALGELTELKDKSGLEEKDFAAALRLQAGLRDQPPNSLHDKAMRLWAGRYWPKLVTGESREKWVSQLRSAQREDGGWSMASIAGEKWQHDGGKPQSPESQAYPTALMTYVMLQIDPTGNSDQIKRGRAWLRANQRASGRWFSPSPRRDTRHYISHAATAYALMCLAEPSVDGEP